jgi:hypothetical protein
MKEAIVGRALGTDLVLPLHIRITNSINYYA